VRIGQILHGYRIVTRPSNADAGKCMWAFAERDGQEFFVKEFLDPKLPKPDSMGTVRDKNLRLRECRRFSDRQHRVANKLRADHPRAGNIVLTKDFFVDGTRFYKVTERIRGVDTSPCELDPARLMLLLRTLVESLQLLHEFDIVHGDLKPENVLLHQPPGSDLHIAKLIDFDDAYLSGRPPARAEIGGNPLYGAPEWLRYLRGDLSVRSRHLTSAVDMFAFGLLAHVYLCGELPGFQGEHDSPAAAVLAGERLALAPRVGPSLLPLLDALVNAGPLARPTAADVADVLATLALPPVPAPPSRLRGTLRRN
jgi:eukaryotic-like serine/threonine-protein kinase